VIESKELIIPEASQSGAWIQSMDTSQCSYKSTYKLLLKDACSTSQLNKFHRQFVETGHSGPWTRATSAGPHVSYHV